MELIKLLDEKSLEQLLINFNYEKENTAKKQIASWKNILSSNQFVLPVLGVQGAGKSSLLNALLMDDIVLPVDSDETTCIPTEIVYSSENKSKAEIVFTDNRTELTPCNEEGLKQYVHQEFNPDNKKSVKCIRVFRNSPLLKNGVTLVDLPGVGSLTSSNVKTTMDYLEKSAGAIFLLRTVPPITNSESIFIKTAWPLLGKVFFIQNQWNDETIDEVNDGKEHSLIVLNKIAKQSKLNNSDIDIKVVNIYKALTAKMQNNIDEVNESGIQNLATKIEELVSKWETDISLNIKKNLHLKLCSSKSIVLSEIESLEKDSIILEKEYDEQRDEFEDEFRSAKKKYRKIRNSIEENKDQISSEIKNSIRIGKENFRNSIRTLLDKGVATDGEQLEKAFSDIKNEQTDEIFENIEPLFEDFIENIQTELEGLTEFSFNKTTDNYSVGMEEKSHFESLLSKGGNAAGGVGGMLYGATLGSALGPIGTVVGGIVGGIVGAFLLGKVGSEAEKAIIRKRANEAKEVIFPLIDKWSDDLTENLSTQLEQMNKQVLKAIKNWLEDSKEEFEEKDAKLRKNIQMGQKEKDTKLQTLKIDLESLDSFIKLLSEVK